jgi:hypothetical protein
MHQQTGVGGHWLAIGRRYQRILEIPALALKTETESELTLNNPMAVTVNMVSRKVVQ